LDIANIPKKLFPKSSNGVKYYLPSQNFKMIQPDQLSILAVDKEVHMVRLLERTIKEKTPYQIYTTANSLEVPDLLIEQPFDLVISDLKMPGFNGIDLLNLVRKRKSKEKIVIITASGDFESVLECMALGAYSYIPKPFSKEQIISVVENAMQMHNDQIEAKLFRNMLTNIPLSQAKKQFESEYIERLHSLHSGDTQKIVEASGLSKWQLRRLMKVNSVQNNNFDSGNDNN